ncbi:MAG: Crp/Fnr family transcriptional regulator [Erysipelotrichaceae bacterium]|nr:Crp/Fnr family transcriptional regulator [Erysipelotrichaceae bacterium]
MIELLTNKQLKEIKIKSYKKDSTIFRESDTCKEIGIVISGEIVIKSFTNYGKEIIYSVVKDGSMFGSNLLFSKDKRYRGDVIASKDSEVAFIGKTELIKILQNNKDFLIEFLSKQANKSKMLNYKVKLLSLNAPIDRLMYYLDINNGEIEINSVSSLAKELNIQRETLSRLLSKLNKNKTIIYKNNKIKRP